MTETIGTAYRMNKSTTNISEVCTKVHSSLINPMMNNSFYTILLFTVGKIDNFYIHANSGDDVEKHQTENLYQDIIVNDIETGSRMFDTGTTLHIFSDDYHYYIANSNPDWDKPFSNAMESLGADDFSLFDRESQADITRQGWEERKKKWDELNSYSDFIEHNAMSYEISSNTYSIAMGIDGIPEQEADRLVASIVVSKNQRAKSMVVDRLCSKAVESNDNFNLSQEALIGYMSRELERINPDISGLESRMRELNTMRDISANLGGDKPSHSLTFDDIDKFIADSGLAFSM